MSRLIVVLYVLQKRHEPPNALAKERKTYVNMVLDVQWMLIKVVTARATMATQRWGGQCRKADTA